MIIAGTTLGDVWNVCWIVVAFFVLIVVRRVSPNSAVNASSKHEAWYRKTYGHFESVLALITRVAERVADKVRKLEAMGKVWAKSLTAKSVVPFAITDIQALLAAAKAYGIY